MVEPTDAEPKWSGQPPQDNGFLPFNSQPAPMKKGISTTTEHALESTTVNSFLMIKASEEVIMDACLTLSATFAPPWTPLLHGLYGHLLWSLLPSFCNYPLDTAESCKDLDKVLCTVIREELNVCGIVCSSLQILIPQTKGTLEGKIDLHGSDFRHEHFQTKSYDRLCPPS